jgi:lysozyme family protein
VAKFLPAVTFVLRNEGGLANLHGDSGGITNFGISLSFYKNHVKVDATSEDIKNLSMQQAEDIYKRYFWDRNRYDEIEGQEIATRLLDLAVNCGAPHSNSFIQRAINKLKPSEHLLVDGQMGIATIKAINGLYEPALYNQFILEASRYYHEIAKHGNNQIFLNGWLNRLNAPMI